MIGSDLSQRLAAIQQALPINLLDDFNKLIADLAQQEGVKTFEDLSLEWRTRIIQAEEWLATEDPDPIVGTRMSLM